MPDRNVASAYGDRRRFAAVCLGVACTGIALVAGWPRRDLDQRPGGRLVAPPKVLTGTSGTWQRFDGRELPPSALATLGARQHWQHAYRCVDSGRPVNATCLEGPPGPIAAHTPEACLARDRFRLDHAPRRVRIDRRHAVWVQSFQPRRFGDPALTVAYAWRDSAGWSAPQYPRFALAGEPSICRFQATTRHSPGTRAAAERDLLRFVEASLPHINVDSPRHRFRREVGPAEVPSTKASATNRAQT